MQRCHPVLTLGLVCVSMCTAGCNKDPQPGKTPVVKKTPKNTSGEQEMRDDRDKGRVATLPDGENKGRNGQMVAAAEQMLVGSWVTQFVIDQTAFDAFVETNMLTEELAESERQRWSDSTISVVFNADGTFALTEPDGNLLAGDWEIVAATADGITVVLADDQQERTLLLKLDENGNGFSCEFADDQYDQLPIQSTFKFSRD